MLSELLEERNKLKQMVDRTPTETTKDQRRQLNCRGRTAISSGFKSGTRLGTRQAKVNIMEEAVIEGGIASTQVMDIIADYITEYTE